MVLKSHDVMNSDYIYRLHYAKFLSSRLTNFVPFSKKNQANKKVGLFNFQQEIIPTQKIIGIDYIVLNSHKINTNIKRRIFSLRNNKSKINNSKYENYPNFHIKSKITSLPSTSFFITIPSKSFVKRRLLPPPRIKRGTVKSFLNI